MFSRNLKTQQGSTLVEVLIAVLVLSLGLLGALKLQVEGVRQNSNSRYTVMASTYAHDALDAITYDRKGEQALWPLAKTSDYSALASTNPVKPWLTALVSNLPGGAAAITHTATSKTWEVSIYWTPPGAHAEMEAKYAVRE